MLASLTQQKWVWVNSGSWWWTGRPGILRFMGSQSRTRLRAWTELNWCCCKWRVNSSLVIDWKERAHFKLLFLDIPGWCWTGRITSKELFSCYIPQRRQNMIPESNFKILLLLFFVRLCSSTLGGNIADMEI